MELIKSHHDLIEVEINGGDQAFCIYELDGELIVKKIQPENANRRPDERMSIYPVSRDTVRVR